MLYWRISSTATEWMHVYPSIQAQYYIKNTILYGITVPGIYCKMKFMERYNLCLKYSTYNKKKLQRLLVNYVAWTLGSSDFCWVDRKTSLPLIITAFKEGGGVI